LVAKNVRNVPLLKPAHHPTAEEKSQALRLCVAIERSARSALRSAHRRWGRLERGLWIRSAGAGARRIITHDDPTDDVLVAVWLAEHYLFVGENADILFAPRGRVLGCLRSGACLVGVGQTWDPARNLFDPESALRSNQRCGVTEQMWEHLFAQGKPVGHLHSLVSELSSARATGGTSGEGFSAGEEARGHGLNNADLYRRVRHRLDRTFL
jgi:hypothetical protein